MLSARAWKLYTPEGLERGIVGEEKGRDTVERKALGSNNRGGVSMVSSREVRNRKRYISK